MLFPIKSLLESFSVHKHSRTPPRPLLTIIYIAVDRNIIIIPNNMLPCVVYNNNIWAYEMQADCQNSLGGHTK